jgi:hypothetical protein
VLTYDAAMDLVREHPLIATGLATFFFGFGAGALVNLYLSAVKSPLVADLRASLSYVSSIVGDGVLLPLVNMLVVSALLAHRELLTTPVWIAALVAGLGVTAYFHVVQAVRGLVNWTMPEPWHWNILGVWHAGYMLAVATLLSLFYIAAVAGFVRGDGIPLWQQGTVTAGIMAFFVLLRMDYATVQWSALVPRALASRLR